MWHLLLHQPHTLYLASPSQVLGHWVQLLLLVYSCAYLLFHVAWRVGVSCLDVCFHMCMATMRFITALLWASIWAWVMFCFICFPLIMYRWANIYTYGWLSEHEWGYSIRGYIKEKILLNVYRNFLQKTADNYVYNFCRKLVPYPPSKQKRSILSKVITRGLNESRKFWISCKGLYTWTL